MHHRKQKTFARKLLVLGMLPTAIAITLCCGGLLVDRFFSIKEAARRNMTIKGDMIAIHVAAPMLFDDAQAGAETLQALSKAPNVASARIFDVNGNVFASYVRREAPAPLPAAPAEPGYHSDQGWFTLTLPISYQEKMLGTLTITDDRAAWYSQLQRDILIVIGVGVAAFACAVAFAVNLRKALLRPITSLAQSAQHVSQMNDYSVRAAKHSDDELGDLTDRFNEMLTQVQSRDLALELRATELAIANTELERFAYVASHDLQEPLRMVASYLQLIERRYESQLDAEGKEFIAYAVDGAARMKRLINDLLSLSRIGTRGQSFEPTDLNSVADDVLANLKAAIDETGAIITRDPLPTIRADRSQLTQLLQNLIANAIKFRGKDVVRVHIGAHKKDNHWVFSVADNGIGIGPEHFERIFVIFQRLCTAAEYPGTGIGLAVCKKIVQRHAGSIWVESKEGAGATFYFTLHKERKAEHANATQPTNRDLAGRR